MLTPLSASKNDNYRYCDSWKSDNFRESNQEKKRRTDTINEAKKIKSNNFTRGGRRKSNIAFAILEKLMIGLQHNYFVFWWNQ